MAAARARTRVLRIETPRLILAVPDRKDAQRMLNYAVENRSRLEPWEPLRGPAYYTLGFWRDDLASAPGEYEEDLSMRLILLSRGDEEGPVLGSANFRNFCRGVFQSCTLGYSLAGGAQGRGLMEEALRAAIGHAFGPLNLHRVAAAYMPRNERSARLLERLGFEREGLAKSYLRIAGRWEDHVLTSKVNPAWRESG
jgi:ribosomal-protein-alanine N-acetyltransferase